MTGAGALLTVGHGTLSADQLTALLTHAGVELLVDVRRYPGSRANPHVSRDAIQEWLPAAGVEYRWEPRLGGRRTVRKAAEHGGIDPGVDSWWQVEAFRAYACHTRTPEFGQAFAELVVQATAHRVAVCCSETVWWRCHRRLIADVTALTTGLDVVHLGHDGRLTPHPVAEGARVRQDGLVVWDRSSHR